MTSLGSAGTADGGRKTPFLCRIGFHSTYHDGAMFSEAIRCNNCSRLDKGTAYEKLMRERRLWDEIEEFDPMEVMRRLYEPMGG